MSQKLQASLNKSTSHHLLSAIPPKVTLQVQPIIKNEYKQTKLKQLLVVMVDTENKKKIIEASAAYALGITNVRAIMLDKPKYYEINDSKIEELKNKDYEIKYIDMPKKEKKKIQVSYYDNQYFLDMSAAYALNLVDVKKFYLNDGKYGPLSDIEINKIKNEFDVEYVNLRGPIEQSSLIKEDEGHIK